MNQVDRYIHDITHNLLATDEEKARFEGDLRAHFAEAGARNEPVPQTIERLGSVDAVVEAFNSERPVKYAGFMKRLAAFLADMALFLLFAIPVITAFVIANALDSDPLRAVGAFLIVLVMLAMFGFGLLYFPLLEKRFGKTLGKHLMRIRVVDESGRPITLGQAIIRRLSFYFDLLALDAIFVPFTERKQRAFDLVARTIVVNEPGKQTSPLAWIVCLFGWAPLVLVLIGIAALGS